MTSMTTVVEISDNEDADDDCVINSVVIVVDDEIECDLYNDACKENKLLADFIKKCLELEDSIGMKNVLKYQLLKHFYAADKLARESSRFQKNLRRANYLLDTDPKHKYRHIKDLCEILKGVKAKKRVPFVTLTTNLTDKNNKSNQLKRSNPDHPDVTEPCKKAKLDSDISQISETPPSQDSNIYFNETCDIMDVSFSMETGSQQSNVTEEDRLLVPQRECLIVPTNTEKKLQIIEKQIAHFKQRIAVLDEQEVDVDSVNSAYIKCEKLKLKLVSLYKERCELIGSQPVKHKGIRLKLEGRTPGPVRVLERFLNKNCNKDGDPPFPDFCDVVNCVKEANEKDGLQWTNAQIMNEASALFTSCGRALQKRRQRREYRDLLYKVNMEDFDRDPADDDPQLRAKLEANKRIAVKKESDILDRFTMLQYAAPKSKLQKDITTIEKSEDGINSKKDDAQETNHYKYETISVLSSELSNESNVLNINDLNSVDIKSKLNVDNLKSQDEPHTSEINENHFKHKTVSEKIISPSLQVQNIETRIDALEHISHNNCGDNMQTKLPNNGAGHLNKSASQDNICNNSLEVNNCINNEDRILYVKPIVNQEKDKLDENMKMFNKLGNNFTVTVEIVPSSQESIQDLF